MAMKSLKILPDKYGTLILSLPGAKRAYSRKIRSVMTAAFPGGVTKVGLIVGVTMLGEDLAIPPSKIRETITSIEESIHSEYNNESVCPVCHYKKKTCSEESRRRLKDIANTARNRASRVAPAILEAFKAMPEVFTANEMYTRYTDLKPSSIRAIRSLLGKEGELSLLGHTWSKTDKFGKSVLWKLTEDPRGNIVDSRIKHFNSKEK